MPLFTKTPERRFEPRRPANTRGVIVAPGLELVCRIVDLSDGGMRLRLDRAVSLPPRVTVVDIDAGTACEATVAWSRGQEAGLKCGARPISLRGLVAARLTPAREAWARAGGR